jgi:hypothetical protein
MWAASARSAVRLLLLLLLLLLLPLLPLLPLLLLPLLPLLLLLLLLLPPPPLSRSWPRRWQHLARHAATARSFTSLSVALTAAAATALLASPCDPSVACARRRRRRRSPCGRLLRFGMVSPW